MRVVSGTSEAPDKLTQKPTSSQEQEALSALKDATTRFIDCFPNPLDGIAMVRELGLMPPVRASRVRILLGALITTAVSTYDVLSQGVVSEHFRIHPGGLGTANTEFSLDDLQEFASIEDAKEHLIARRSDEFSRFSLDEQLKWFKSRGIDLTKLALDWDATLEVFQRRNVIVHVGGRVSRQYLEKVPQQLVTAKINEELSIDEDYVSRAFDCLVTIGILLVARAWSKLIPDNGRAVSGWLGLKNTDLMLKNRWSIVKVVSIDGQSINSTEESRIVFRVNEWLARKRLNGVEEIQTEVAAWDVSALGRKFKLAKAALLDDLDQVFDLIPVVIESQEVQLNDVRIWPILQEARNDPRFVEYVMNGDSPKNELNGLFVMKRGGTYSQR
jgi:hypothetical protein